MNIYAAHMDKRKLNFIRCQVKCYKTNNLYESCFIEEKRRTQCLVCGSVFVKEISNFRITAGKCKSVGRFFICYNCVRIVKY